MHTIMHNTGAPEGDITAMYCREEETLDVYFSHTRTAIFEENIAPAGCTPAEAPVAAVTLTDFQRNQPIIMAAEDDDDLEDDDDDDDLDVDDVELDEADIEDVDLDDDDLDDDIDLDDDDDDDEEDDIV